MTNQEKFIKAHQIAKEIKAHCSDYRTAFSLALRQINSEIKRGVGMEKLDVGSLRLKACVGMSESVNSKSLTIESVNDFKTRDERGNVVINRTYINMKVDGCRFTTDYSVYLINIGDESVNDIEIIANDVKFYESAKNNVSASDIEELRDCAKELLSKLVSKIREIESESDEVFEITFNKDAKLQSSVSIANISIINASISKGKKKFDVNKNISGEFKVSEPASRFKKSHVEFKKGASIKLKAKKIDLELLKESLKNKELFSNGTLSIEDCK